MCCCHLCHCESRVHSDSGPQSAPGAVWLVFGKEKNHKRPSIKWMFKVFWEVKWCRGKCEGVKAALHPAPAPASQPGRSEPFAMLQNCNSKAAHTTPHHYSFQVESKEQATDRPQPLHVCPLLLLASSQCHASYFEYQQLWWQKPPLYFSAHLSVP